MDKKELIKKIKEDLKGRVNPKRYEHILGVVEYSKKLGLIYNVDQEELEIAALLHDMVKEATLETMRELVDSNQFKETKDYLEMKEILHGFAGAEYARLTYGIEKSEILNSIRYHTIGRENMSLFELIIYIADGIEMGREYPQVSKIRELVDVDIYAGVLYEVNHKLKYLVDRGAIIHTNTVELRNWLLKR